jgi:glycosyltransferase involved in cell wall biosynthesis
LVGAELDRYSHGATAPQDRATVMTASIATDAAELARLVDRLRAARGWQAAFNLVQRSECAMGLRRPRLALYDHALHLVGGGQKYGCLLAAALRDRCDVTLMANRPITTDELEGWYGAALAGVAVEIVELPSVDGERAQPDPTLVVPGGPNPFAPVSAASGRYDLFVNNSMNERVRPRANIAAAVCHFPERRPAGEFYMDRYKPLIYNSEYTAEWIRRRWGIEPDQRLFPPVEGGPPPRDEERQPLILSVARFERAGSKRQLEMARAFVKLRARFPDLVGDWRLVLAGGVEEGGNDYLRQVEEAADGDRAVEIRTNIPAEELAGLYRRASLFWHLCGAGARDPGLCEHFGMTVAEAMRYGLVPVVFDGGGMPEIVDDAVTGYRVADSAALLERTLELIADTQLRQRLGTAGAESAARFGLQRFATEVQEIFDKLLAAYTDDFGAEIERLRDEL